MIVGIIVVVKVEGRKEKIEVVDGVGRVWVRGRVMVIMGRLNVKLENV